MLAIVIPAYKWDFLEAALTSIAAQTDRRFRVYIGDDCSPYALQAVAEKFRESFELVYQRYERNIGGADLVAQWERCIDLVRDEKWIWLFSDDDLMAPDCVASFYSALAVDASSEHGVRDIYRFPVSIIDRQGTVQKYDPNSNLRIEYSRDLAVAKMRDNACCFAVEYVFSKERYVQCGGFQKFDLAWWSDLATWLKFSQITGFGFVSNEGVFWRASGSNITQTNNREIVARKLNSEVEFMIWLSEQFPADDELISLSHYFLWNAIVHASFVLGKDVLGVIARINEANVIGRYSNSMIVLKCEQWRIMFSMLLDKFRRLMKLAGA